MRDGTDQPVVSGVPLNAGSKELAGRRGLWDFSIVGVVAVSGLDVYQRRQLGAQTTRAMSK
jgi:hypothetical protein